MASRLFDRDKLLIRKLSDRKKNKVFADRDLIPVNKKPDILTPRAIDLIGKSAGRIKAARKAGRPVVMAFGAHTIKNGMAPTLTALIREGWVTHLSTNGAGIIHDWEFAFQGKTSEDVRENVDHGQFGIWDETGYYINLALIVGAFEGLGYGESVGKMIFRQGLDIPEPSYLRGLAGEKMASDPDLAASAIDLAGAIEKFNISPGFLDIPHPYRENSLQSAAYELKVSFTGHPMIGCDIIYVHPMNHGAAIGRTSLRDFLLYAGSISNLEHGVYISVGSAVMSPMIFEKSLSMAQNIEIQKNSHIDNHFMLIVDLAESDWDWQNDGEPPPDNPAYYLRFCKTFNRMGGEMHYLTADNRNFLLALYQELSGTVPSD
jgi:hypothetical protein